MDAVALRRRSSSMGGGVAVSGRFHSKGQRAFSDDYAPEQICLGHGMNGEVFRCKSKTKDAKYAAKPFRLGSMSKAQCDDLFTECEIFLAMDHPNVARLVDVYASEPQLTLVMECMEGGEVFNRVAAKGKFTNAEAQSTVRQMMLAVNYIHRRGIVHRDIKLENFLYARESDDEIKLIDFGFGSYVKKNQAMNLRCGTISYVAPEVLNKRYDQQCDLWSMGVVTFILLSGYMPFMKKPNESSAVIKNNIKRGNVDWRQDKWLGVPEDAQDFVRKLLEVVPTERLTAAAALKHPWLASLDVPLRGGEAGRRDSFDEREAEALQAFHKASRFKKTVLRVMAWSLTLAERQELREVFLAVDKDRQGTISIGEFKSALKGALEIEDAALKELFAAVRGSCAQEDVHYSDFLAAMCTTRVELHDTLLRDTFKRFDVDNSGNITLENLAQVLGDHVEAEKMIRIVGCSGHIGCNGHIDFNQFVNLIKEDRVTEAALLIIDREFIGDKSASMRSVQSCKSPAKARPNTKQAGCFSCFAGCFGRKWHDMLRVVL